MEAAPHPEPLNCGQLLLNSLEFALEVWASRPAVFKNGATSQQGYANQIKGNYSHVTRHRDPNRALIRRCAADVERRAFESLLG